MVEIRIIDGMPVSYSVNGEYVSAINYSISWNGHQTCWFHFFETNLKGQKYIVPYYANEPTLTDEYWAEFKDWLLERLKEAND